MDTGNLGKLEVKGILEMGPALTSIGCTTMDSQGRELHISTNEAARRWHQFSAAIEWFRLLVAAL